MKKSGRLTFLVLLAAMSMAGCSDAPDDRPASRDVAGPSAGSSDVAVGPLIRRLQDPKYGMQARITGRLRLRAGCLLIGDRPVVWPTYVQWDREAGVVTSSRGRGTMFHLGGRVVGGGGTVGVADVRTLLSTESFLHLQDCSSSLGQSQVNIISEFD